MIKMIKGRASVHKKRVASFSDRGSPQRCDELNKVQDGVGLGGFPL
jgi:hypothetical protein